jgi:glutathione S-transferase
MTDLTLYHAVPSRGMVVRWLLEELGEPYTVDVLDLAAGDQKRPDYLAVNPLGKVPALRHRDTIITETAAICLYLADAFPQAGLAAPVGSPLRGPYLRWMLFATCTAEPALLWRSLGTLVADAPYQPFAELDAVVATLRDALRGRPYIVGDRFSAADVMLGSTILWGMRLMRVLPEHPELVAYWEGLEKRAGWQRASAADAKLLASRAGA